MKLDLLRFDDSFVICVNYGIVKDVVELSVIDLYAMFLWTLGLNLIFIISCCLSVYIIPKF